MATDIVAKRWSGLARHWDGRKYSNPSAAPALSAPTSPQANASGSTITVTFTDASGGVAQHLLQYSANGTTGWTLIATISAGVATYDVTGLAEGTYYYRLYAQVGSITSDSPSSTVNATVSAGENGASLNAGVLTLTGTGFPLKTRAAPVWWDNFADMTNGQTVYQRVPLVDNANVSTYWSASFRGSGQRPYATLTGNRVTGKPSLYHDLTTNNYNCSATVRHLLTDTGACVYKSWWWKSNPGGNNRQVKPNVIYGSSADFPEFYLGFGNFETFPTATPPLNSTDPNLRNSFQDSGFASSAVQTPVAWDEIIDRWVKFELVLVQSAAGTANGTYAVKIYDPDAPGGATTYATLRENVQTRSTTNGWRQFDYGSYAGTPDGIGGGMTCPVWTDDPVLDDSANHARVVIGNSSTYASCTKVEDQPSTAWASNSITCTFNKGGFASSSTAHVFIVTGAGHSGHGSSTYIGSVVVP